MLRQDVLDVLMEHLRQEKSRASRRGRRIGTAHSAIAVCVSIHVPLLVSRGVTSGCELISGKEGRSDELDRFKLRSDRARQEGRITTARSLLCDMRHPSEHEQHQR